MNEEQLIGNLVDHLLDEYGLPLPPLTKKGPEHYEISVEFLGEEIKICADDVLTALQMWDETLAKYEDKITGRG